MNTPTHLLCGACIAHALARRTDVNRSRPVRWVVVAMVSFVLGMMSHLLLDRLPHCAWIANLDWFKPLPMRFLLCEALFGVLVAVPALWFAGRHALTVLFGMAGGMYPDIEKVLAIKFGMPDRFVLFEWHSLHLSNRTWGLSTPALIALECLLISAFLYVMWRMRKPAA